MLFYFTLKVKWKTSNHMAHVLIDYIGTYIGTYFY